MSFVGFPSDLPCFGVLEIADGVLRPILLRTGVGICTKLAPRTDLLRSATIRSLR